MSIISTVLFFKGQPEHRFPAPVGGSLDKRQASKIANRQAVLSAITDGFDTITEICDETELSKSAVLNHINQLMEDGLVRQTDGERRRLPYHYEVVQ